MRYNSILSAAIAAIVSFTSCQKEALLENEHIADPVFTATIDDGGTKTTIDSATGKVSWVLNDEITVTDAASVSVIYKVSLLDASGKATFTKKDGETQTLGTGPYTAVYGCAPAALQSYGTTAPSLPMEASSETTELTFKVTDGLLELTLTKESVHVKTIVVSDGVNSYTLSCEDVDISSGTKFFMALPEATYTSIVIYNTADRACIKSGLSIAVQANHIKPVKSSNLSFSSAGLDASGTANCYVVSGPDSYTFRATKGNSSESAGTINSVCVLWESFGTGEAPSVGDLVSDVSYSNGYIRFTATDKKGNAVIAAKDASGAILWSWHIWLTDKPANQTYRNSAGTMMDRNLGATSSTPGDVRALGLLYQWGRKDPFLGSASVSGPSAAAASVSWPSAEDASEHLAGNNTLAYATANPMVFLKVESTTDDWYCTNNAYKNNQLWASSKTIYDPCPPGYRTCNGGDYGVWSKAFGTSTSWDHSSDWDSAHWGMNYGDTYRKLGTDATIWYPAAGYLSCFDGSIYDTGTSGNYRSCTTYFAFVQILLFRNSGNTSPSNLHYRAYGYSVRCQAE